MTAPAANPQSTPPSQPALDTDADFVRPKGRLGGTISLGVSQSIDNSEGGISRTFFPQIMHAFGVGDAGLGLLNAIGQYSRMIFGPLWAMLADRVGRKRVLFIVTGLWGLWTLATAFATSWTMLLVLYGIAVVGTVASEPILNGLLGSLYAKSERGKAFGTVRATSSALGFVLTPLIGQFGNNPEGWRWAMGVMGALSVISGFLILAFVHEPERVTSEDRADLKTDAGMFKLSDAPKLFKIPTLALMAPMLLFVTSLVLFGFMGVFQARNLGYGITNSAYLQTVMQVGAMFSALLGGWLADRFRARFGEKGRIILFQLYCVAFAAICYVNFQMASVLDPDIVPGNGQQVTNSPSFAYYAATFVMGLIFSIGFSGCVLPMVSSVAPTQLSATAFALLFSLIQGFITATLSLIVGMVSQRLGNLQLTLFWVSTVPYLINALYWFVFYRVYPRDVALQAERTRLIEQGRF